MEGNYEKGCEENKLDIYQVREKHGNEKIKIGSVHSKYDIPIEDMEKDINGIYRKIT